MPYLDSEVTVGCPYDPHHRVVPAKLVVHLTRCRKSHRDADVKICVFNQSHHIPGKEYDVHLKTCKDRALVECWEAETSSPVLVKETPAQALEKDEEEESWENDLVKNSYDPTKNCKSKNVLRKIYGATPAERKMFRAMESLRLKDIQSKLEEKEVFKNDGKLLVTSNKELLNFIKKEARGVARTTESAVLKSAGRGKIKKKDFVSQQ